MTTKGKIYLFYLGFVSTISQILLLKEFLISFYGNELSLGIILSIWLFWVGSGSFFGQKINKRIKNHESAFQILIFILPLFTILVITLIKYSPFLLHTPVGEYESVSALTFFAFIILSLNCFVVGYLFSLGAHIQQAPNNADWKKVNQSYAFESLGSVIGGLIFTFILNKFLSPFRILILIAFLALLYFTLNKVNNRKKYLSISVIITSAFILLFFAEIPEKLIIKQHWNGINDQMNFIESVNTKYQNLSLLQLNGQYTLYSDGKPVINIPDKYGSELFIHPVFAEAVNPKSVLLLGGGVNGILNEILKYNINKVDYIELDNNMINLVKTYLDSSTQKSLVDKRVEIFNSDGREFISSTNNKYDVIILASGDPTTLNQNRYFTYEFFNSIKNILNTNGIFAFSFSSSEDYFGEELENYNLSIYRTFKKVFSNFVLFPGTKAVLIGANNDGILSNDEKILSARYKTFNLKNDYFSEYLFDQLLPPERINYVLNTFETKNNVKINEDSSPITYFFNIVLWNKIAKSEIFNMKNLAQIKYEYIFISVLLIPLILVVIGIFKSQKVKASILYIIIFVTGFSGLIISLIVILNFQTVFGSVYESVGVLVSMNMLGLFAGSLFYNKLKDIIKERLLSFIIILTGLLLVILLPLSLELITNFRIMVFSFVIMFVYNCVIGMIYSNINYEYFKYSADVGRIYSLDIFGSLLGALLFSSLLLPLFGVLSVIYFVMFLFSVILLLTVFYKYC
jgi:spermidine synthase